MNDVFTAFDLNSGLLAQLCDEPFPTDIFAWDHGPFEVPAGGTCFGYVHFGTAQLTHHDDVFHLRAGMYFAIPGALRIMGGSGILIRSLHHRGFFHIGGPAETMGRLRYIDGCTDSLLIPPVMMGDPCLNLLHLPPGTRQTQHTHPSFRIGLVLNGSGDCVTPDVRIPLRQGMAFVIAKDGRHSFHTEAEPLRVLAYHPDSDCGPTHENHPMMNRTIIGS